MALQTRFGRFDMENQLIFDLKDLGFPWQYLALGLLVAALIGIIAVLARPKSELRFFCTVWGSLLALWIGVLVSTTYPAYSSLIEAERHGNFALWAIFTGVQASARNVFALTEDAFSTRPNHCPSVS